MIYTAAVLEQGKADPAVLTFLTAYLEQQRSLLKATSSDHPAAVQLVPDATLRGVLQDVYAKAQNL